MSTMVDNDNNTIIIIHLPDVSDEQIQAVKDEEALTKLEEGDEPTEEEDEKDREKQIVCVLCNRSFRHNSSLKRHLQLHDETKAQTFECSICMKKLQYNSSLKRHMKLHSEEVKDKSYTCDICQKTFGYLTSLVRHRKLHNETEKEVYTCDLCGKTFVYSSSLKRHILLHTEGKTFECPTCNKFFGYATSLARHIRLHTSRQDFSCLVCKKTLRSEKGYLKHVASCQRKNGVLETIEIDQTRDDDDMDDNFFSDTVKSEEGCRTSDEEDTVEDIDVEDGNVATMASFETRSRKEGQLKPEDEAQLSIASVTAQLEGEDGITMGTSTHRIATSALIELKRDMNMVSRSQESGKESCITVLHRNDGDENGLVKLGQAPGVEPESLKGATSMIISEGEAARSLIDIGISDKLNATVMRIGSKHDLQSLVNAAVVHRDGDLSSAVALARSKDGVNVVQENATPVKGCIDVTDDVRQPGIAEEVENTKSDTQSGDCRTSKDEEECEIGHTGSVRSPLSIADTAESTNTTAAAVKCVSDGSAASHRFVATINGKEVELQLAAGSQIIQCVVPGDGNEERTYIIGQAGSVGSDGTFVLETPMEGGSNEEAEAILRAVYLSGTEGEQAEQGNNEENTTSKTIDEEASHAVEQ